MASSASSAPSCQPWPGKVRLPWSVSASPRWQRSSADRVDRLLMARSLPREPGVADNRVSRRREVQAPTIGGRCWPSAAVPSELPVVAGRDHVTLPAGKALDLARLERRAPGGLGGDARGPSDVEVCDLVPYQRHPGDPASRRCSYHPLEPGGCWRRRR